MRRLSRLQSWLRTLRHRSRLEQDMDQELRFHIEQYTEDLVRGGMAPAEASRLARVEFGSVDGQKEEMREALGLRLLDELRGDLRYTLRQLRRSPTFTAVAILTLALGIGANTAMFTIVDALLLRPAPFPAADRLGQLYMGNEHGGNSMVAPSVLRAWRDSPVFDAVEGVTPGTTVLEAETGPVARASAFVTPGVFDMLGVRPIRGRLLGPTTGQAGNAGAVLISEGVWRSVFGSDPDLIGRGTKLDGLPVQVVGILPADFRFPQWNTEIWRPIDYEAQTGFSNRPMVFLRFAAGVPETDALRAATDAAHAADPSTNPLRAVRSPLAGPQFNDYARRAATILAGGVDLVFLVLCANVCSLLLARFGARRREFSLCSALGASRGRLLRQAVVEGALLGVLGVIGGLGLAWGLVAIARYLMPEPFLASTLNLLDLDLRAVGVAMGSGIVAVSVAGVLPAWMATRVASGSSLSVLDRGGTETRGARALTKVLLITEVALACTLVLGSTLLVHSFVNLTRTDLGFDPRGLMTVLLSNASTRDRAARLAAFTVADEEIRRLPGVQRVSWSTGAPMAPNGLHFDYEWQSDTPGAAPIRLNAESYNVGPDFFEAYGLPILKGRSFRLQEEPGHVIVGERLASALWPGSDPIGHSFRFDTRWLQVVGVAKEMNRPVVDRYLVNPDLYEPFVPGGQSPTVSIRCGTACPSEGLIRQRLLATVPAIQVVRVQRLEDLYLKDLSQPRATAALGSAFAMTALLAAAGGLFSVLSYTVGRRRREFGIRRALGASADMIGGLVFRDGLAVAVIGLGIGSIAAWSLARVLASLEYGVAVSDPVSWLIVVGVVGLTVLISCWRPARDAMRVDPALLLKEE